MVDRIVGRIPVFECLRAKKRRAIRLFTLRSGKGLGRIRAEAAGLPVQECDRRQLDALACGVVHQGVVLEAEPLPVLRGDEWAAGVGFPYQSRMA